MYQRREFLKRAGASIALGGAALQTAAPRAAAAARTMRRPGPLSEHTVTTNGIRLHVTEQGRGTPVLFVHGFPDTAYTWRGQMAAVAAAGYRAIAPDTRGYAASSAPRESTLYTPLQTVGDLVGLLDALGLDRVAVVGHDWGAYTAHQAALLRPDRLTAVFGMSFPYTPRGPVSTLDALRAKGLKTFYIFDQLRPDADREWADAADTIPSALYWPSGSPPAAQQWNPLDGLHGPRGLLRPAPPTLPAWVDRAWLAHNVAVFTHTGFHAPLNYYRSIQDTFKLTAPWLGAPIRVPSFYLYGAADPLNVLGKPTLGTQRPAQPGLIDIVEVLGVGHWPHHEAAGTVTHALLRFLHHVNRRTRS